MNNAKRIECDALEKKIRDRIRTGETDANGFVSADDYIGFCNEITVNGEKKLNYIEAVQHALNANKNVFIPYHSEPLYIDRSIIVNSGNSLKVHPETTVVLVGDGIMLRNRNVLDGHYNYVEPGNHSDCGIRISGGIWEAPNTIIINLNRPFDGYMGSDALFLLHNVVDVSFSHIKIRHSKRMGLMIGNCTDFTVTDIEFMEDQNRDGIHVEGPASWGIISNIRGKTGDDVIALNAWDWTNSSLTFGSIHDVIVENIHCQPGDLWSEMRLHPGNYVLPDGRAIDCSVYNVVMQDISGVHTIKMYNQPNLMPGYNTDKSFGLGMLFNLFFRRITVDFYPQSAYYTVKNSCFEVHADGYNFNFFDINVNYPLKSADYSDYSLIAVGPISATWKISDNPNDWFDFFDPNSICHTENITVDNVTVCGKKCTDADKLLLIRKQTVNPNYPETTPAGGTGYGTVRNINIS